MSCDGIHAFASADLSEVGIQVSDTRRASRVRLGERSLSVQGCVGAPVVVLFTSSVRPTPIDRGLY